MRIAAPGPTTVFSTESVSAHRIIAAPVSVLFDLLTDLQRWPHWMTEVGWVSQTKLGHIGQQFSVRLDTDWYAGCVSGFWPSSFVQWRCTRRSGGSIICAEQSFGLMAVPGPASLIITRMFNLSGLNAGMALPAVLCERQLACLSRAAMCH